LGTNTAGMPIAVSVPQGDPNLETQLRARFEEAAARLPFRAQWSVLLWKAQSGVGWTVMVRGPSGMASEDLASLDDDRLQPHLMRLLLQTSAVARSG
jgi:hypothetical protein